MSSSKRCFKKEEKTQENQCYDKMVNGLVYYDIFCTFLYIFPASSSAPGSSDAMSILDTITSLNQEASVRASSSTDKGRKAPDDSMHVVEEGEEDMSIVEEGDSDQEKKTPEGAEELTSEVQALEVKTDDMQEQVDLGRDGLIEEVKMEEEESEAQEQTEDEKEKAASKTSGKPTEEKQDEDLMKSTSQAKQKARERIKEGELPYSVCAL